jgi:hypothetical protein
MSPYTVILNGSVAPKYLSVWGEEKMAAKTAATPRNTAAATTSTPEFKAWFKNSKVVDDNGNPSLCTMEDMGISACSIPLLILVHRMQPKADWG